MKRWVLDMICCPVCKGTFQVKVFDGDDTEITEGTLTCTSCNRVYPISSGIPDLLPK